jgi:hypothetical protein
MTSDHRMTWGLIHEVLSALERHGYHKHDNQHTGQAIGAIFDLAHIYEGSQHHPHGPSITQASYLAAPPEPPGPEPGPNIPEDDLDAVTLTHAEVRTVLTSLDLAADWKRDRAEMCADCPDQSCFGCELRLREARIYDQLAIQLLHDEQATRNLRRQAEPHAPPSQPGLAADKEAGQ